MREVDYLLNEFKPFDEVESNDLARFRQFCDEYGKSIYDRAPGRPLIVASALVVNPDFTKILTMYHKLHGTYRQFGGHADGKTKLARVAKRELKEESGARGRLFLWPPFKLLSRAPFDLTRWTCPERIKNGILYPAHEMFDVAFLFKMSENKKLKPRESEVGDVRWITLEEWRDFYDENNAVVKANPKETEYRARTYQKIKSFMGRAR